MKWLLDTNVLSESTKRRPAPAVLDWVRAQNTDSLYTHSLVLAEVREGIAAVPDPGWRDALISWLETRVRPLFAGRIIEADEDTWMAMLQILQRTRQSSRTVPVADLILAASAQQHGMVVVTHNLKHFADTGVPVLNPWLPMPVAGLV